MITNLPHNFPALSILEQEGFSVQTNSKSDRPLRIAILNLMPIKITTEADLLRLLSYSPIDIEVDFFRLETHVSKNTPAEHLEKYYKPFSAIKHQQYDGCIITGAPVELLPFEDVTYWSELKSIFDWARANVASTLYICWAAQAAMYHFYGIPKYTLEKKVSGVFLHTLNEPNNPLFHGFDDEFFAPHSRHTTVYANDIKQCPELQLLSESPEAGVYIVSSGGHRELYVTGHSEYHPLTLHQEYTRDLAKGLESVEMPKNYYPNDDITKTPIVRWRSHANLLFTNWLNLMRN